MSNNILTMRKILGAALLVSLSVVLSCSKAAKEGGKAHPTAASIGQTSEVVLVLGDAYQQSDLKDSLEALLTCDMPGLPQSEPYFRVTRICTSIDKSETKMMHSRLLVKIKEDAKEVTLGSANDVWARPQLQLLLTAPSVEKLSEYLAQHGDYVRQLLMNNQLKNQTVSLARHHAEGLAKELKTQLGYTVDAPEELQYIKKGKDFVWASSRTNEKQLNMVFYTLPYEGENVTDAKVLATLRDSVMKVNIPGRTPDQWMETTWEEDVPIVTAAERKVGVYVNGVEQTSESPRVATEMRGLWQMHNGAMGGPFVSISFVDTEAKKLVVAEGFVFSPSTSKRDLMRRLEASLHTFRK